MNLADAIAAEPPGRRGPVCGLLVLKARLESDEIEVLEQLFEDVRVGRRTGSSVARILTRLGDRVSDQTVLRHVRGECSCPN